MSLYARILDGVAVDICADPATQFHPQLAAQFEPVPDDVVVGSRLVDGVWQAPDVPALVPALAPAPIRTVSPVDFMLRFTAPERVAVRASTDPIVIDWLRLLDDPRLQSVHLDLPATREAVAHLVTLGLLTQARADEILS